MTDETIDTAARAYVDAATALVDALLAKLQAEAPDIEAKAQQALARGERMQLVLEFDPAAPEIRWQVVNDYDRPLRLMTLPGRMPTKQ